MIAHVAGDDECPSSGSGQAAAHMQKLMTDLAGVAKDPAKPKKMDAVKKKLLSMRQNPVQAQLRRDKEQANNEIYSKNHNPIKNPKWNPITNAKVREKKTQEKNEYLELLATTNPLRRSPGQVHSIKMSMPEPSCRRVGVTY